MHNTFAILLALPALAAALHLPRDILSRQLPDFAHLRGVTNARRLLGGRNLLYANELNGSTVTDADLLDGLVSLNASTVLNASVGLLGDDLINVLAAVGGGVGPVGPGVSVDPTTCSMSNIQCCASVDLADSPLILGVLNVLGVTVDAGVTANVGVNCDNVPTSNRLLSESCAASLVCCVGTTFEEGSITTNCTSIVVPSSR